jgi:hypothetical protein
VVTGGGAIVVMVGSATPPAIASTVTVKVDTPPVASVTGSRSAVNEEPLGSIIVVSSTVKTLPLSGALTGAGAEELRGESRADAVGSAYPLATVLTVTVRVDNPPVVSVKGSRSSVKEEPSVFVIVITEARKVSPSFCALAW